MGDFVAECKSKSSCGNCLLVKNDFKEVVCQWCYNTTVNVTLGRVENNALISTGKCYSQSDLNGNVPCITANKLNPNATNLKEYSTCTAFDPETVKNTIIIGVSIGAGSFVILLIILWYRRYKNTQMLIEFQEREIQRTTAKNVELNDTQQSRISVAAQNQGKRQGIRTPSTMPVARDAQRQTHASAAVALEYKCLSTKGLRIRNQPSSESDRVGVLDFNAVVMARNQRGNWIEVQYKGVRGWCMIATVEGQILLKALPREEDEFDKIVRQTVMVDDPLSPRKQTLNQAPLSGNSVPGTKLAPIGLDSEGCDG